MRRYFTLGIVLSLSLLLFACASQQYPYPSYDLTQETWQKSVAYNTQGWRSGADKWFLTGDANQTELAIENAPDQAAVSTMQVNVPNFDSIEANGRFQVQIFGTTEPNSVYIYGPNRGVRASAVEVRGRTLVLTQTNAASGDIEKTIIRIGVKELNKITQAGCGTIEARHILSENLTVDSLPGGDGNVYISGNIRLNQVNHAGNGMLSIFDTITRHLVVNNDGAGKVNISGRVGVNQINQTSSGTVNLIGAYSNGLVIMARGSGKVSVYGRVNVRSIDAGEMAKVYVYYVDSTKLDVLLNENATIGLGGKADILQLDMYGSTSFYGRYLQVQRTIVRTHDLAHANITGHQEVFASADGMSSIYYFGNEGQIAKFTKDKASITVVGPDGSYAFPAGYAQTTHTVPLFSSSKHHKKHSRKHAASNYIK